MDGNKNVYITGGSDGTWGSPLNPYTGWADIVVLKLQDMSVKFIYRNGGEIIPSGVIYTIQWQAPAVARHYTLRFSSTMVEPGA